ncbi:hypothetical protein XENOCAPTIV_011183 [Xenoophorus captivus]|uniref:Secreted protein n=1 Tax=Xenoophorus captivus TaxID=1517983 RepID=A0ABV0RGT4_9TELE
MHLGLLSGVKWWDLGTCAVFALCSLTGSGGSLGCFSLPDNVGCRVGPGGRFVASDYGTDEWGLGKVLVLWVLEVQGCDCVSLHNRHDFGLIRVCYAHCPDIVIFKKL